MPSFSDGPGGAERGFALAPPPPLDRPGFRWTADIEAGGCMDLAIEARVAKGVWVRGWEAHLHGFVPMFYADRDTARSAVHQACAVLHQHYTDMQAKADIQQDADAIAWAHWMALPTSEIAVEFKQPGRVPGRVVHRFRKRQLPTFKRVGVAAALAASRVATSGFSRVSRLAGNATGRLEHEAVRQALAESARQR